MGFYSALLQPLIAGPSLTARVNAKHADRNARFEFIVSVSEDECAHMFKTIPPGDAVINKTTVVVLLCRHSVCVSLRCCPRCALTSSLRSNLPSSKWVQLRLFIQIRWHSFGQNTRLWLHFGVSGPPHSGLRGRYASWSHPLCKCLFWISW